MYNSPTIENHRYKEIYAASPHTIILSVPEVTSNQLLKNVKVRSWNLRGGLVGEESHTKDGKVHTFHIRLSLYDKISQSKELNSSFDRVWYDHKACVIHIPHALAKDYGMVILVATLANGGECVAVDMGNDELLADTPEVESEERTWPTSR